MANNKNCGCYGALSCVPGPLQCAYQPADPCFYHDFPFYTGPCAPGPCTPPYKPLPPCCCGCGVYPVPAMADATSTMQAVSSFCADAPCKSDDNGCLPMSPAVVNWKLFAVSESGILIRHSGTYLAVFTINLPPQQRADTQFALYLNGVEVAGSRQRFAAPEGCDHSLIVSAQAIVQASPNSLLTLAADAPLDVTCEEKNLLTLTLTKL